MNCKWCKNKFVNKTSLNNHQKTAKYCLKLQGKKPDNYSCIYCQKNFSRKYDLQRHQNRCKISEVSENNLNKIEDLTITLAVEKKESLTKDQIISKLEAQINRLQEQLASVALEAAKRGHSKMKP